MKNKLLRILLPGALFLILLFVLVRQTGIWGYHTHLNNGMLPSIQQDERVRTSVLLKKKRNALVVFERTIKQESHGYIYEYAKNECLRVAGLPGDTIQIKDGWLYVNNRFSDDSSHVMLEYFFWPKDLSRIAALLQWNLKDFENQYDKPFLILDEKVANVRLSGDQLSLLKGQIELGPMIEKYNGDSTRLYLNDNQRKWTPDNYGPVIVPSGHYFLLGDHRNYSTDSRHFGPVPSKAIQSVVF